MKKEVVYLYLAFVENLYLFQFTKSGKLRIKSQKNKNK